MHVDDHAKTRLSESVPDPLVGREFDGYRIDEMLGRGGMGVVYKATQLSLGRPVAIKVLPDDVLENRQFIDRFEREVDILAKLAHPNIVTVFERGEVDGRPYIAMELVRGTSLRDVMRKGPLPPSEALVVVRSVLSALEHAHEGGIVHRDIKPENVLVAPGGIVKVADFGLSRHLEGDGGTRLTKTYVALGTFEYMSPEQREMSRDADARSDLYATGVVLYEMIAGELPIGSFEPLSRKRPHVCDARIDDLIDRSLKKSPDSRWQDARSMGDAVSRLLSTVPPEPAAAPRDAPMATPSEQHGPKWKRVLSNIFGHEIPLARIEGKLPRKFAEKVLEDVAVQRYLGRIVTLWPHFPGGMEFSKEGSRLKLELGGMRGDDPVRDKRVAAAVGVVLEANAHGKLKRIAVADHAWEDAHREELANPPIVGQFEPIRPSAIGVQSQVVSGVERRHPGLGAPLKALLWSLVGLAVAFVAIMLTRGGGADGPSFVIAPIFLVCGLVAGLSFLWFVVRGARPPDGATPQYNYGLSFAVTVLWVGIVVANSGNLRDEQIAWLCVGAIASVFLLPRLGPLLQNAGRAVVAVLVGVVVLAVVAGAAFLGVSHDEPVEHAEIVPAPMDRAGKPAAVADPLPPVVDTDVELAVAKRDMPQQLPDVLYDTPAVRAKVVELVDGADILYAESFDIGIEAGKTLTLTVPRDTLLALYRSARAAGKDAEESFASVGRSVRELAATLAMAAHSFVPLGLERRAHGSREFEKRLGRDSRLGEPLVLPEVEPQSIEMATVRGALPDGWLQRLRDDTAAWKWLRTALKDYPHGLFPAPELVQASLRDGRLVFEIDETWRRQMLVKLWFTYAGDAKFAGEFLGYWCEAIAAGLTIAMEARYPGIVKRSRVLDRAYELKFEIKPFQAK